ncbi:hypothetical protein K450DRAFT_273656 [Umbelopsis ramanniana AG]|uniref:DUF7137 domain-containing protein n=1 Tax=Umbelopsis ramanniana AG TaxID=1314678 RepID=A0AAD5E8Q5_UMBRA|nr:uncharacterized protein K450DRAFT_273656 [Umbelopsis ramanniana AG]KAI8577675.1 hypothetical protein K450DRAFT_273656 [Umbelopsis ramanniana AG]
MIGRIILFQFTIFVSVLLAASVSAQTPVTELPNNITISDSIIGSIGDATSGSGYLILTQPNIQRKPTPLYGIGNKVEFVWKYADGLAIIPKSLTFAIISPLKEQFIIGENIPGDSKNFVWDTELFESDPLQPRLLTGKYIVRIWDERGPDAPAAVGRLVPYRQLAFSMYSKQAYQDMDSKLD